MTRIDDLNKSQKALQRRRLVVKLKRLWKRSSGHPSADELLEVLGKRLAQKNEQQKAGNDNAKRSGYVAGFIHQQPR